MDSLPPPRPRNPRWEYPLVCGLFALSGACALVYQLGWVRRFTLEFGSTSLAVSSVVAVFMGGLAWGSSLGGRLGTRSPRPLATYGLLECALALYAGLSPWTFSWALGALSQVAARVEESFAVLAAARLAGAVILILPPTLLMGATLPLLAAWVERWREDKARGAGTLYGLNTLGAMAGTLAGGFLLLPVLGLQASLWLAAAANLALGLACLALARAKEPAAAPLAGDGAPRGAGASGTSDAMMPAAAPSAERFLLAATVVVALAGAASMACQVIWTRVATLVLGGSAYSFTIVLATFLAGLGLGALAVTRLLGRRPERAGLLLWGLLAAAGAAVAATGWLFPRLPAWAVELYHRLGIAEDGARATRLQMMLAGVLLLPPTLVFGGIFPAALAALARPGRAFCAEVGRLYAWNTAGCIAGVLAGGFFLLPVLGPRNGLMAAAWMFLAAAALLSLGRFPRRQAWAGAALAAVLAAGIAAAVPAWDRQLMASGPHSYAESHQIHAAGRSLADYLRDSEELLYYADGLVATVSVTRDRYAPEPVLFLSTDGKMDGSSHFDMPTQRLSAHLPMLLHPSPREACVIGMGTGCTAGSAALYPGVQVRVVEIERRMVEAAKLFAPHNHDLHRRDNVEILVSDGRLHLLRRRQAYDVIISEPSNPWLAGASDLFTADFFRRASGALREGGVFAQWIQLYGLSTENFRVVARGFLDVFPHVCLATTIPETDVLLVGAMQPFSIDPSAMARRMEQPEIAADLADPRVGVNSVHELLARLRLAPEAARAMAGEGERHTDDRPILAYRAARDLPRDTGLENDLALARHASGIAGLLRVSGGGEPGELEAHLSALADAYERFRPEGMEAEATRRLLAR